MYLLALLLLWTPLVEQPATEGNTLNAFLNHPVSFELTPQSIDDHVKGRMRTDLEPFTNTYDGSTDTIHHITAKRNEFKLYQDGKRYLTYAIEVNNKKVPLANGVAIGMQLSDLKAKFPEMKGLKTGIPSLKLVHETTEATFYFKRDKLSGVHIVYYIE